MHHWLTLLYEKSAGLPIHNKTSIFNIHLCVFIITLIIYRYIMDCRDKKFKCFCTWAAAKYSHISIGDKIPYINFILMYKKNVYSFCILQNKTKWLVVRSVASNIKIELKNLTVLAELF
jgi:hypothetical protein